MSDINSSGYWNDRYRNRETGWDMGTPTPAFVGFLEHEPLPPGKTLVLGSGSGYDAVAFARRGFEVTAVDFASEAIHRTRALAVHEGVAVTVVERDLFNLSPEFDNSFDYVVEYVTFCAIDPSRRSEYVNNVWKVLKPGGILIGLFFPVDDRPGGPPFGVNMIALEKILIPAFRLLALYDPPDSVGPRKGRELMSLWKKVVPFDR